MDIFNKTGIKKLCDIFSTSLEIDIVGTSSPNRYSYRQKVINVVLTLYPVGILSARLMKTFYPSPPGRPVLIPLPTRLLSEPFSHASSLQLLHEEFSLEYLHHSLQPGTHLDSRVNWGIMEENKYA